MSELKPCPFCGEKATLDYSVLPNRKHWFITCECCGMMYQSSISQRKYVKVDWNTRPIEDELNARIAELEGIIKSDDERLTEAGLKVNLYFGCDTAEIMAEEILSSRARISELEAEIERFTAHSDIERQDDKCSGHGDISNFPPVMGSGDGLGW